MAPICLCLDLLAFVALKVLSNNHLHLLVIRFASLFSFPLSDFPSWFCCLSDFKVLVSTDSHQLGFADASFRFVPLQRLHLRACQTVFTPPLPISRFFQPLNGWFAFFGLVGLFRPTGTSRVSVFRVLRYIRSVAISSTFCVPRCLPSLFGFLPWSAWAPLPLGRSRSFRFHDLASPWPLAHRFL